MDVQLKRGLIDICVLKVLAWGDSYGYQILKDMSPYLALSESTLYPILKRLESADLLTVYSVEHNSRLRKYYRITEAGHARIGEFLEEWQELKRIYEWIAEEEENGNDEA